MAATANTAATGRDIGKVSSPIMPNTNGTPKIIHIGNSFFSFGCGGGCGAIYFLLLVFDFAKELFSLTEKL